MTPKYIADYGNGKYHILDRVKDTIIWNISLDDFRTLTWMKEPGDLAIEAAHGARISKWSASQEWKDEDQIREFYSLCEERNVELRLLPEKSIKKYRDLYFPDAKKTDEVDLRSWAKAINDNTYIWDVALRPKNVEFHDPNEDIDLENLTRLTAGNLYKQKLKDASRIVSAGNLKYKETIPGKIAFGDDCINAVYHRLKNHTSDERNGKNKIVDGVAHDTFNGKDIELPLLKVLGIEMGKKGKVKNPSKPTQYTSCMMTLIDQEGKRYMNPSKPNQPVGFRTIAQFGMISSGHHFKPGFLRPKFYHHGVKEISKIYFQEIFGDKYMDSSNFEHDKLRTFIMTTSRIAYEQTIKAMRDYLNTPKNNLENFLK